MGKNAKAATQRAKKKQQKNKKRQQKHQADKERRSLVAVEGPRSISAWLDGDSASPQARAERAARRWDPTKDGLLGLARKRRVHPHLAARIAAEEADFERVDLPDVLWTLDKVAALDTGALLAGLEERGVHADQVAFVENARSLGSAWTLAEALWAPALPASASIHDRDFLGLAAHVLWTRWCSEIPSREMILENFQDGMDAFERCKYMHATDRWIEVWDRIKPFLVAEMRTFGAAEERLGISEPLHLWIESLGTAASSAEALDTGLALRAGRVFEEVLAQFTDEQADVRNYLSSELGGLLFRARRPEEGERVLRELIAGAPERAIGYVSLADALPASREGQERALALLEEAAACVTDAEDWDIEARIEGLRAELAKPNAAGLAS